ncbi:MAG: trigger factor [Firmicutes bacterium]|nr:trigger factor [Bacillota bacterium]
MQFNLEKLDKNFVALEVTVNEEEVEEALAESYKRVVKKVNIPGFRKGHVPRAILEKHFGKEVLYEDAVDIIVPKGYLKALEDYKLEPIDQPKLEVKQAFEAGKPFVFTAKVEVVPEVELGQYKGLEIEKAKVEIKDEQVTERLAALQERHAELTLSDKKNLEKGDFAVIDFEGYIDGQPFSGGAAQAYCLEIGSGSFIPGFEEQLIGMEIGTDKDIKVTFPEDYPREDLAGKEATFKVTLKEIKVKEIPAADDEFAQSVGDFNTIDELKEDLRKKLTEWAIQDAETSFAQAAVNKAVENAKVDVPETLVKREMDDLLHRFEHNLAYQGLTLEKYLEYTKKTREEVLEDFRPEALKRVKSDLVLTQIAQVENLEVTEEELTEKIQELAVRYQHKNPAKLREILESRGQLSAIKQAILLEKAADFIKENTKAIEAAK